MNWTVKRLWRLTGVFAVLALLPHCQGTEKEPGAVASAPLSREMSDAEALNTQSTPCKGPVGACAKAIEPLAEVCSSGGWCWKNPSLPNDVFQDAWAVDEQTVLVVGPPDRVLHWRGDNWLYLPSGTSGTLHSIWAASPTDAWAVGQGGAIVHWDGVQWTLVRSGGPSLSSVFGTGSKDVWAGGAAGVLLHWDGAQWTEVPSGSPHSILSLWANGPRDLWVSTLDAEADDPKSYVMHWNGQQWSTLPSLSERVLGLWGFGSEDVWVVGSNGLLAHWTGANWQKVPGTKSEYFRKVRGSSPTQMWVVGYAVWRFDGETLHRQQYEVSSYDSFYSVTNGAQGALLAVGSDGTLVQHREGDKWEVEFSHPDRSYRTFTDVWASAPEDAWALRDDGEVFHWNGVDWSRSPSNQTLAKYKVSGSSASDVWVVGRLNATGESAISHFDGVGWSEKPFPKAETFTDVWALNASAAWVVGGTGTIRQWNGSSWQDVLLQKRVLSSVHGSSADNVWAVGPSGAVLQWNGHRWVDRSFDGPSFKAVWVSGPDDVWVIGDDMHFWHWDGRQMQRVEDVELASRTAFYGRGAKDIWAVGDAGAMFHWNGVSWTPVSSGTRRSLRGLWGAGDRLFTVGTGEVILHRD